MRHALSQLPTEAEDLVRHADPSTLPIRVPGEDRGEIIAIARDHVTVEPADADEDAPTKVTPMRTYRGIAVIVDRSTDGTPSFRLTLLHAEDDRSVLLAAGPCPETISREWKAWGRALSLPLIAVGSDGVVHAALKPLGALTAEAPAMRRRGSALVGRRSRFSRRRVATRADGPRVHRGEREIIART